MGLNNHCYKMWDSEQLILIIQTNVQVCMLNIFTSFVDYNIIIGLPFFLNFGWHATVFLDTFLILLLAFLYICDV